MKRLLIVVVTGLILILFSGCSVLRPRYVPIETKIDSVYIEKVVERVDTVLFSIPADTVRIAAKCDSSHLETGFAVSDAVVDSTGVLRHSLWNKVQELKKEVVFKDRVIEKRVEVEKEVPVEVEVPVKYVPAYYRWMERLFYGLLIIGIFVIFIVAKLKYW